MRRSFAVLVAWVIALVVAAPGGALAASTSATAAASDQSTRPAVALRRELEEELGDPAVASAAGVYVRDLIQLRPLFEWKWDTPRIPASNTKLFTSTATMDRYGTEAVLTTAADGDRGTTLDGTQEAEAFARSLVPRGWAPEVDMADGSGLQFPAFFGSLPIAGVDGTLAPRRRTGTPRPSAELDKTAIEPNEGRTS